MRDKHEVRVKEKCLTFLIAFSSQVKIKVTLRLSIFLPPVLPVVRSTSSMPNGRKKGNLNGATATTMTTATTVTTETTVTAVKTAITKQR